MCPVQKKVFTHHRASHELIFEFIGQHPLGEQESFVSSTPVESVKTIGLAFIFVSARVWRSDQHRDALNDWTKREAYFVGKDLKITGPRCERWRKVHKSA